MDCAASRNHVVEHMIYLMQGKADPYEVPKSLGMFQMLESPKNITTTLVAQRIMANHEIYEVIFYCPVV